MAKIYKILTAKKEEEIEDKINKLASEGWDVDKFGYEYRWKLGETHYYALMVKGFQRAAGLNPL